MRAHRRSPPAVAIPLTLLLAAASAFALEPAADASELPAEGPASDEALPLDPDAALDPEAPLELGDPLYDDGALAPTPTPDPWEGFNRGVFKFNRGLDTVIFDPVTTGYQFVVPEPGRRALHRFVLNLDTPVVLVNQMLQLRPVAAATTLTRFILNTALGFGGLLDLAAQPMGITRIDADFGQTLARYGSPSGPYLMLPLFGPSTVRDAFGNVVDIAGNPVTYLLGPLQWWTLVLSGGEGLVVREAAVDDLEALEKGSIDFYSALRSAYLQSRAAAVREARDEPAPASIVMAGSEL